MMVTSQDIQYWINKTGEELGRLQRFTTEFNNDIEGRLFDAREIFREVFGFEAHNSYFRNSCVFAKTICELEHAIFLYIEDFEEIEEQVYVKKIEFVVKESNINNNNGWRVEIEDEDFIKWQKKIKKWGRFYIAEVRLYLSRTIVKK